MGNEGSFPLMTIFDVDIVVALSDVEFGKQFGVFELIYEVWDKEKGIGILDGIFI